ncbi:MAG: hypothetical protein H6601_02260 [Flavobacteriales bacterium]|nr:hypothetical protein [Flavobacteriales bacterium]
MHRQVIIFFGLLFAFSAQAQDEQKTFPTVKADSVVLYIMNQQLTHYPKSVQQVLFDANGLKSDREYNQRFRLSEEKASDLAKTMTDPSGYVDAYYVGLAAYYKVFVAFYRNGKVENYLYINSLGTAVFEPFVHGLKFGAMSEQLREWVNAYVKALYPEFYPIVQYDEERDFFGQ